MKNHKILILRSKFHKFYIWSNFNECGMFQRFQNYIQNCSMMNIAESPCLKSIFAIWGSGEQATVYSNVAPLLLCLAFSQTLIIIGKDKGHNPSAVHEKLIFVL